LRIIPWYRLIPVAAGLLLISAALMVSNFERWRYFLPLSLVIGFVAARWWESRQRSRVNDLIRRCVRRWPYPWSSALACAVTVILALIPTWERGHFPYPANHDELSYHLAADTFARGRLANPTPPGWEHFESFHINIVPTYHSKYQPGMGLVLAAGQVIGGHTYYGMLLALLLATLALDWMFHIWLPARWALTATLLSVLAMCGNWSDCYFPGGPLAVCGGALLLGCYRRVVRRGVRAIDGMVLGLCCILFFWTRPFEGAIVLLTVGAALLIHLFRTGQARKVCWPLMPAGMLALLPAIWFQTQLNQACTGSPWRMPYLEHERQYGQTPLFLFQPIRQDVPKYRHVQIDRFNAGMADWHEQQRAGTDWLVVTGFRFGVAWGYFFGILWLFPLAVLPELWANRWTRLALLVWVLMLGAIQTVTWFLHHYAAPGFAAWALVVVMSLRYAGSKAVSRRGRCVYWGRFLVVWGVIAFSSGILLERVLVGIATGGNWTEERARIMAELDALGGRHVIFLRYGPEHDTGQEWVYNSADIPGQRVIWARAMDAGADRRLMEYHPGRRAWLLRVDSKQKDQKPELVEYDP
jgi:hypothetical protein